MTLSTRLNLIITLLLLFITVIGSALTIHNARENIEAEVSSATLLSQHIIDNKVAYFNSVFNSVSSPAKLDTDFFHLERLNNLRHLTIEFISNNGELLDHNHPTNKVHHVVPDWFVNIIDKERITRHLPTIKHTVYHQDEPIGQLILMPDVHYEIIEEWQETKASISLLFIFFLLVNCVIYFVVKIALKPIHHIAKALTEVEAGNFDCHLPPFTLSELSLISRQFNVMTHSLQASRQYNHRLTQRLIHLQEDERKKIAQELHDEIGQHLTAIHIDASLINSLDSLEKAKQCAASIHQISLHLMDIISTLLRHLRPPELEELGLQVTLQELIDSWCQRNERVKVRFKPQGSLDKLNSTLSITLYRIVQECLTNISRHADAQTVEITLTQQPHSILLTIQDDGIGFDQQSTLTGFGLAGIKERVEGLSGKFVLQTGYKKGTVIEVILPYKLILESDH